MRVLPVPASGGPGPPAQALLREQAELLEQLLARSLALNRSLAQLCSPARATQAPPDPSEPPSRRLRSAGALVAADVAWKNMSNGALSRPLLATNEPPNGSESSRQIWSETRSIRGPHLGLWQTSTKAVADDPLPLPPSPTLGFYDHWRANGLCDDAALLQKVEGPGGKEASEGWPSVLHYEDSEEATGDQNEPALKGEEPHHHRHHYRARMDGMFPKTLECKSRIEELTEPKAYRIEQHYNLETFWTWLVVHPVWQQITQSAIIANVLWIAVDIDYNHAAKLADAQPIFRYAANFFSLFFVMEITARYLAFARPAVAFQHGSFLFDLLLAVMMAWETWVLALLPLPSSWSSGGNCQVFRILRLLRLLRALRTTRAIRNFPEVMILVSAGAQATRSVCCVLALQTFLVYFFAIVFTSTISGERMAEGKFETVPQSMYFLNKQLLIGFDADTLDDLTELSLAYYAVFMLFLFMGQLTLMNMLTGILCDVASQVREDEKTAAFEKGVGLEVARIASEIDEDQSGVILKDEFETIVNDDKMLLELHEIGVDIYGLIEFVHKIFLDLPEGQGLTLDEFTHVVHNFCGFKLATVKDLQRVLQYLAHETSHTSSLLAARTAPLHD